MFETNGFGAVTVASIADEVGMAASTLYRHFPTKEHLVLWDEHDPVIDRALEQRLGKQRPLEAIRDAFVEELSSAYEGDVDFQLRRIKYIYATEQLHAAAVEADLTARAELAVGLAHFLSRKNRSAAPIMAGAALVALDVAFERWAQSDGKTPLRSLVASAFDQLEDLTTIT